MPDGAASPPPRPRALRHWAGGLACFFLTVGLAFGLRMLEWPSWQNPEYRLGGEMLLATHDAYHWVAGAEGFGLAVDHPMAEMLRLVAGLTGTPPAVTAFWFPAVLASLVAGIVFLWAWALGSMQAGVAAGLVASLAPGFLARTLLGYYDTDLVTLFFPLLMTLAPACWAMRYMLLPQMVLRRLRAPGAGVKALLRRGAATDGPGPAEPVRDATFRDALRPGDPLRPLWTILLGLSGLLSWWTQEWHSVFPYLLRYNVVLLACMALVLGPRGRRGPLFLGALAYALPALGGLPGCVFDLLLLAARAPGADGGEGRGLRRFLLEPRVLAALWICVGLLLLRGEILATLINHANAYLKHSGDARGAGAAALVYPSVAQSIIEVQDLGFAALFPYFHPWMEAAVAGLAGFVLLIFRRPGTLFLLPLAVLALLSTRLGGRMVMFGAPVVALGLTVPLAWFTQRVLPRALRGAPASWLAAVLAVALFVAPFAHMIPALSQGPIINRRHAAALAQARSITPADARLWLWWDWGYAAHYFARRATIADGAQHAGPSLYLPAAVFATDNPRFARQVIRETSRHGNEPGAVFAGLDGAGAQALMERLRSPATPLVAGRGRQFVVVSFEMLRLGFWISNFGNWNFVTRHGEGGALSIVPQALAYRLKTGEVRLMDSGSIIYPASIAVFDETGVIRRNYVQEWFDAHPDASARAQQAFLAGRRNVHFLFNRVTDEKLAMDEGIFSSLMVRLLLCDPQDPRISPYFKLVYDNVFARIYEVLPAEGDTP
ncbi:MAG: hypothetical protein HDQ90_06445 [Desulfovibrio sp.]|nr:hypothetical protein [Desulfovibrio sp.]